MAARLAPLLVALGLLLGAALPSAAAAVVRLPASQETAASPVPDRGADPVYASSYFGARYYRADIGRFTTIDPVYTWQENLADPQRWNRYAYVRNNPLRWTDPDGREIKVSDDAGKDDRKYIREALIEYVRREAGREQFNKLAGDQSHTVVLSVGLLNSPARLQIAATTRQPVAVTFGETRPDGATAAVVIDRSVHTAQWASPAGVDLGGVTTMGHEFAHADAWASRDIARYVGGDRPTSATGPAMQTGKSIYGARPTLTKEEAAAIVDAALGIKK